MSANVTGVVFVYSGIRAKTIVMAIAAKIVPTQHNAKIGRVTAALLPAIDCI